MIKFNKYNVTNGTAKARVFYSLDNRVDNRKCVTIYARDYGRELKKIFTEEYENNTDIMTDYFETGQVTLFEDHKFYNDARKKVLEILEKRKIKNLKNMEELEALKKQLGVK